MAKILIFSVLQAILVYVFEEKFYIPPGKRLACSIKDKEPEAKYSTRDAFLPSTYFAMSRFFCNFAPNLYSAYGYARAKE